MAMTATNKQIKAKRAKLVESSLLNEINGEITEIRRLRNVEISTLVELMDFAPTNTQSLTFANCEGEKSSKALVIKLHNSMLKLQTELDPSLKIYKNMKETFFGIKDEAEEDAEIDFTSLLGIGLDEE